ISFKDPTIGEKEIEREIVYQYFSAKMNVTDFSNNEIIDVLSALLLEESTHTSKGEFFHEELTKNLSAFELRTFTSQVILLKEINPESLDRTLGGIKGLENSFFSFNVPHPKDMVRLYFFDSRDIRLNGILYP